MGYLSEYINKGLSPNQLSDELQRLIQIYKSKTGRGIFLYVAAMFKRIPEISMNQEDFYVFRDILKDYNDENELDIYIETPGGNGITAEEIAKFLHNKFQKVNFVISGEAKSAGTILAMSGNEIYMTETGSLGPIDAQVTIGRSIVSAYDYIEWIKEKMDEAKKTGKLNPVDATMISQITPGEIQQVFHSLEYAKDLVKQWLPVYKFNNWDITETRRINVTKDMKEKRASDIAESVADHSHWRTHGRSLKIDDLTNIGLKVENLDLMPEISEIVYRIQFVCKLIFETTTIYKLFISKNDRIFKQAVNANINNRPIFNLQEKPQVVQIDVKCPKCGREYSFYKKIIDNKSIDENIKKLNIIELPSEDVYKCECGHIMDLRAIKNEIAIKLK